MSTAPGRYFLPLAVLMACRFASIEDGEREAAAGEVIAQPAAQRGLGGGSMLLMSQRFLDRRRSASPQGSCGFM
jgi:hypothetical protein